MATLEQLPDLDQPYPITDEHRTAYQRDGHILLRNVCTKDELAPYREAIAGYVAEKNQERRALEERDTYGKAFLQTMNLWLDDAVCKRFVFGKRFARIAAELMGVNGVRLYHDQALFKEGHGGLTPWHQDQHYWPLATDNTITMWMPLHDITADMGVMDFATGSHTSGYFGDFGISDESQERFEALVKERGFERTNGVAMQAGDATFHAGWNLHCAPPNHTPHTREVMTIIYYEDGARVAPVDNANRKADLDAWLPGCEPGGPAASAINPVLYP